MKSQIEKKNATRSSRCASWRVLFIHLNEMTHASESSAELPENTAETDACGDDVVVEAAGFETTVEENVLVVS